MLPDPQFYEFIRESIASHDRQLGEITDDIAKLKTEMTELKESVGVLRDSVGDLRDSVGDLRDSMGGLAVHAEATSGVIDRLAAMMGQTLGVMRILGESVQGHERRITDLESPA